MGTQQLEEEILRLNEKINENKKKIDDLKKQIIKIDKYKKDVDNMFNNCKTEYNWMKIEDASVPIENVINYNRDMNEAIESTVNWIGDEKNKINELNEAIIKELNDQIVELEQNNIDLGALIKEKEEELRQVVEEITRQNSIQA